MAISDPKLTKPQRNKAAILIRELRAIPTPNLTLREKNRSVRANVHSYKKTLVMLSDD